MLGHKEEPGLSADPAVLHTGGNSGYQAVNLAKLFGARRVALLGYDMRFIGGRKHWHEDHRDRNPDERRLPLWAAEFETMLPDLGDTEVINCTPGSAITCFPYADIEETL